MRLGTILVHEGHHFFGRLTYGVLLSERTESYKTIDGWKKRKLLCILPLRRDNRGRKGSRQTLVTRTATYYLDSFWKVSSEQDFEKLGLGLTQQEKLEIVEKNPRLLGFFKLSFNDFKQTAHFEKSKRIVCAAFLLADGLILCGPRHSSECLRLALKALHGESAKTFVKEQGFVDQYGTFYNRESAFEIASQRGQFKKTPSIRGKLFSEDLY